MNLAAFLLAPFLVAALAPPIPPPSATDPPARRGVWPLDPPRVVAGFDPPDQPWSAGHRGVDLAGLPGAEVRSAVGGTVLFAGTVAGRGVVTVGHGELRVSYEPVAPWVVEGDRVRTGDVLGLLDLAGSHCAPTACLHWGLRDGDGYVDPRTLVGRPRIRLLPLHPASAPRTE